MKYQTFQDNRKKDLDILLDEVGIFWAFNPTQFKEGMKKNPSTTKKYSDIGGGGFLPSNNLKQYIKGFKDIDNKYKKEIKKVKAEEAILYELNNHEAFYTGDISDTYEVLKGIYSLEEVQAVYSKNYSKADL